MKSAKVVLIEFGRCSKIKIKISPERPVVNARSPANPQAAAVVPGLDSQGDYLAHTNICFSFNSLHSPITHAVSPTESKIM